MFFDLNYAVHQFPKILSAAPITLLIAIVSMLLGIVIGFLLTLCRMYRIPVLQQLSVLYISFIRGTPMVVQLYLVFFGVPTIVDMLSKSIDLPLWSSKIPPITYAFIAFALTPEPSLQKQFDLPSIQLMRDRWKQHTPLG